MDNLLDKLETHTLSLDEAYRLRRWLQNVYLDDPTAQPQDRIVAILSLGAVESLIIELEHGTSVRTAQLGQDGPTIPAQPTTWLGRLQDWWEKLYER